MKFPCAAMLPAWRSSPKSFPRAQALEANSRSYVHSFVLHHHRCTLGSRVLAIHSSIHPAICLSVCLAYFAQIAFVSLGHVEFEGELLLLRLDDQVAALARPAAHVLHLELLRLTPAAVEGA